MGFCIECHRETTPGVFADWAKSRHANANITCLDCHLVQPGDQDIAQDHAKYYGRSDLPWGEAKYKMDIASIVTPKDCSRCHPDEATQYSKSKHANTIEIMWKLDPWLNKGMNSDIERKTGCFNCHGTVLAIDENGKIDPDTWPNTGILNMCSRRMPSFMWASTDLWNGCPEMRGAWMAALFLSLYLIFFLIAGLYRMAFGTLQGKLIQPTRRGQLLWMSTLFGTLPSIGFAVWLMPGWLAGNVPQFGLFFDDSIPD